MRDVDLGISTPEGLPRSPSADARSPWENPEITVSPALFGKFQKLIYRETGIWLSESKTALLCGRLARRLRALQLSSLKEYYQIVAEADQHDERVRMIDCITTNETRFFREPKHFEYLHETVFPKWRNQAEQGLRSRKINVWSAGCSSGEEAYSVAMLLADNFSEADGWQPRVLATDISTRVLATAKEGIYRLASSADIPGDLLQKYMLKGYDEQRGKMKVSRELRQMVEFRRLNLSDDAHLVDGTFDLILCRNVLIYFDIDSKINVIEKLIRHLSPQGFLFIGHSENLHSIARGLRSVAPTVYAHKSD